MLTRCATVFLFLVALAGACVAEPFRDGDTVVFFGDSITHGGLYHKYIVDFYRTRFPERKIRFVNSGIGGDTAAKPVVGEFDFAGSLNREMLSVAGLAPGQYELSVDGCAVGEWSADELARGVNLSLLDAMPQVAQSRSVFDANERNRETERVLRNHHSARWAYSGRTDVDDVAAFAKWIEEKGEKGYFAKFVPGYVEYWPRYREVRAELLAAQEKVYALANPRRRCYRVVKSETKGSKSRVSAQSEMAK